MFCIVAFVVFVILGIFSARYRKLAKKAWGCVARKVTLRPCDTGFKQEAKDVIIGKLVLTKPKLARFLDKYLDYLAALIVVLSIWSLLVVFQSGLNLLVYDTCTPKNVESCSLGGESCGISIGQGSFVDAVKEGNVINWTKEEIAFFAQTISRVPDRFKAWNPTEYTGENSTYYNQFDAQKPVALEVIDPGCKFCAKLWGNIKEAGFENKYNLTYIAYAIPEPDGRYKFPNSPLIVTYLEAVKMYPLKNEEAPTDWRILERLFSDKDENGALFQENFNLLYSHQEAEDMILKWLKEFGYSDEQIAQIKLLTKSDEIAQKITKQIDIVQNQIKTIKIPTIIFDERRYDRVIGPEKLQ